MIRQTMFDRYIGIDYSGAAKPTRRLAGLAVYCADCDARPHRVPSSEGRIVQWTRKGLAEWIVELLRGENRPTLVGIDHAFSFPDPYFQKNSHLLEAGWTEFLKDFQQHWPTDGDNELVSSRRASTGRLRSGDASWLRLTDKYSPSKPSSVFHFDNGPRDVAYSTHAGLPWLLYIRQRLKEAQVDARFWPFDGWDAPERQSAIVEVYPTLWHAQFPDETKEMNPHRRDAYSVARWMSLHDQNGLLRTYFDPGLPREQLGRAKTEGWIFGVRVST